MRRLVLPALLALTSPAQAFDMPQDEAEAAFVTSNVISTFYHELGHALIDVVQIPVLGREEDAADTLSALLVHSIWEEESAKAMIIDTANAYLMYNAEAQTTGDDMAFWDEHSLDMQRYYNLVCLFYGAAPDQRADLATELDLPADRAERCPDEFTQADAAWGAMLADLAPGTNPKGLRLAGVAPDDDPIAAILQDEIQTLNASYALPDWVDVTIADCGEANAFYNPGDRTITLCSEYAEDLKRIWEAQVSP